jgi:hypothetical protein
MADLLEAGLDAVLARHAQRRGLVEKPRAARASSRREHVPAAVKREVWKRAGGCCEWPLDAGGVCGSKLRLEHDHVQPLAAGGVSTVDGVRLLCAVHNAIAARRAFGDAWMDRFTRRGAGPASVSSTPEARPAPPIAPVPPQPPSTDPTAVPPQPPSTDPTAVPPQPPSTDPRAVPPQPPSTDPRAEIPPQPAPPDGRTAAPPCFAATTPDATDSGGPAPPA